MADILIEGTKSNNLDEFIGSIPDTQLIIVPDPVTGKLLRSTFGQLKADIILAFGSLSYLDQIIEIPSIGLLPQPGEVKKIYVITGAGPDENKQFRWGGSVYIEFPAGSGDVAQEAVIRGNADAALQANIDAEYNDRINADAILQNNITAEGTGRANADILLQGKISAEANTRSYNDNILQGLINAEGTTRLNADNALSARIDTKVDKVTGKGLSTEDYTTDEKTKLAGLEGPKWKGTYTTKAALDAANVGGEGNEANVDSGVGADVTRYIWDASDDKWVVQQGASTAETAASIKTKYESNPDTNAFTDTLKSDLETAFAWGNHADVGYLTSASSLDWSKVTGAPAFITGVTPTTGGTGQTAYATGDMLYASATNVLSKLAATTDGYVLTLAGGVPTWAAASGGGGGTGIYPGTGEAFSSYAKGDLIYASAINELSKLSADTDYKVLTMISGVPAWSASGVSWSRSGNAGTTPGADFIGTTDDKNFIIKRNSITMFQIGTDAFSAGNNAGLATGSNYFGNYAGGGVNQASNNFFGQLSGYRATNANNSNFFGTKSGYYAIGAVSSNFFGQNAGSSATNANNSNFFGTNAGLGAAGAVSSNFIGSSAGNGATNASNSNFFGSNAGNGATSASNSNFFGSNAGNGATSANNSNFFGSSAGLGATVAANSNLFGMYAGQSFAGNNIGANNIIIGTTLSLPDGAANSINIGGILFGTGTRPYIAGNPSIIPQSGGRIGIGVVTPNASAILEIASTTMGVLGTRMTSTQRAAIASPSEGLEVFDLTLHKKCFFNGNAWEQINSTVI